MWVRLETEKEMRIIRTRDANKEDMTENPICKQKVS